MAALLAALVRVLSDIRLLGLDGTGLTRWLALIGTGVVPGVGLSWAIIRGSLSDQVAVDDVEDRG